jgi:hypothetical protein
MSFRYAFLVAGVVVLAAPASAETIERTVKANQRSPVGGLFTYEVGTCRASAIPNVTVRDQPRNGTVAIHPVTATLPPETNCGGQKVSGPALIYTPNKGFKGADQFTIDFPFATNEARSPTGMSRTYRINVE